MSSIAMSETEPRLHHCFANPAELLKREWEVFVYYLVSIFRMTE
jgi:hypothetical protein